MAKGRYHSYFWALHTRVANHGAHQLSDNAEDGLRYARDLALAAKERANAVLHHIDLPRLTVAELAERDSRGASTIRRNIAQARYELFGEISDNAIHKRLQRKRGRQSFRQCAEPRCREHLPRSAPAHRHYCDQHRTPRARVRRHRRSSGAAA